MSKTRHRLKALKRRGSKRHDKTCRSHGGCAYCASGRQHKIDKGKVPVEETK